MGISLKELKKNRLTPAEKWLLDFIDGVEPKTYPNGNVEWFKDGKWVFDQDFQNGQLLVNWNSVWEVLEEDFTLNDDEVEELLTNMLYDYTDNGKLKVT